MIEQINFGANLLVVKFHCMGLYLAIFSTLAVYIIAFNFVLNPSWHIQTTYRDSRPSGDMRQLIPLTRFRLEDSGTRMSSGLKQDTQSSNNPNPSFIHMSYFLPPIDCQDSSKCQWRLQWRPSQQNISPCDQISSKENCFYLDNRWPGKLVLVIPRQHILQNSDRSVELHLSWQNKKPGDS